MKITSNLFLGSALLLVATGAVSSSFSNEAPLKKLVNGRQTPRSTTCGGHLTASSGRIAYRIFNPPAKPHERCVWTIRSPNATSYDFSLQRLGMPFSLMVSGLSYRDKFQHVFPNETGLFSVNGSVAVITFHTGAEDLANGFYMHFYANNSNIPQWASSQSEDIILSAGSGDIKFPTSRETYDNLEFSTFVLTPQLRNDGEFERSEIIFIRDEPGETELNHNDKLVALFFDKSTLTYTYVGSFNGGDSSVVISHDDIILIVFQSDESIVGPGFKLYVR